MDFPRDSQRSKVIKAEAHQAASDLAQTDAMAMVTTIIKSRYWVAKTQPFGWQVNGAPVGPLTVGFSSNNTCAALLYNDHGTTTYPATQPTKIVIPWQRYRANTSLSVMHALAHVLAPPNGEQAWHSPAFCATEIELVGRFIGPAAADALRVAFKAEKVKTRTMSPEAREAARERWLDQKAASLEADLRAQLAKLAE